MGFCWDLGFGRWDFSNASERSEPRMLTLLFDDVRLLKYLTFRAAMAAGVAFALTLLLAPRIIAWLRRKKVGENVEKGDSAKLDEMHRSKNQTPTMGGIFLLLAALGSALLVGRPDSALLWGAVVILVAFGLVGFVDDYVKLTHPGRKGGGIKGRTKIVLQSAVAIAVGCGLAWDAWNRPGGTALYVPFLKDVQIDLGAWYPVFAALVIVGASNAVNITDGLDGLAAGTTVMALLVYAVIAYVSGRTDATSF